MSNLVRSLSLVLEEFYCNFNCVGVSSITGEGFNDLIGEVFPKAVAEFQEKFAKLYQTNGSDAK